ncbi:hypothetical protein AKJ37_00555 [candidate division MSBL1 archaeon SCGC-AAA259I09]|uniref:Uncharacterized protein n=1 Tax=candidate division MSBL1 archaeon SCGC-AAA259I09 TaxID=1698267 RepID=A0A133UVT3_9EURY|nr:hypothetical protein AKJ37_00555 [candidate division MSBL1 archaeon SCGC-AAA259I09]
MVSLLLFPRWFLLFLTGTVRGAASVGEREARGNEHNSRLPPLSRSSPGGLAPRPRPRIQPHPLVGKRKSTARRVTLKKSVKF